MSNEAVETHVVAKLFSHPTRRFKIGDTISEADVVDAPALDWATLKKNKVVVGAETKAGERAVDNADTLQAKAEEANANPPEPVPAQPSRKSQR